MNSHQRRTASRRRHMLLPLSKEVALSSLRGRQVYSYRMGCDITLNEKVMTQIATATVHRHIGPQKGGRLDLLLVDHDGSQSSICLSMRGIRLKNPADRAPRPHWVERLRKHRAAARGRT